jgi:3-deoxy-manno-octulosonate cytidylyltransferase (CMP-KDO synthetase)
MSFLVVVPARYASTRLPGKPLEDIAGKAMIQHVWERAQESDADRVIVATDDARIADACDRFGARRLLTRADHPSGTDRLAEVVDQLDLADDAIVVNVQGDEPLIPAAVIDQVATNLSRVDDASIATLCEPIHTPDMLRNPNAVKVVFDARGMALYFSRACIPWPRDHQWNAGVMPTGSWFRHLGIYAYRAGFLRRYTSWQPAPQEQLESLEQLRALHQGERIHVEPACAPVPGGIDTPEDLEALRQLLSGASAPDS